MKKKNYSAYVCVLWSLLTIVNCLNSINNFANNNLLFGIICLCVSVGFGFVTGILFNKAIETHRHNQQVEWLEGIARELEQDLIDRINPFEDFEQNKGDRND